MNCKICNKEFDNCCGLATHLRYKHITFSTKDYYDQFLKKENDGICYCRNKTKFINMNIGYHKYCSTKCMSNSLDVRKKSKQKIEKHTEQQNKEIQKRKEQTMIEKYNVKHALQVRKFLEKSKCSWLNHSLEYNEKIQRKREETSLNNWGTKNPFQSSINQKKARKTNEKKYGGPPPACSQEVQEKSLKNSFRKKEYILPSGKMILLQGEEPQFLDYVFNNNLLKEEEINFRPIRIPYIFENKIHYYFADFKVIPFNLIVEVKSWWILKIQKGTEEKINACRNEGYNFIMILDKKYEEFISLINNLKEETICLQ